MKRLSFTLIIFVFLTQIAQADSWSDTAKAQQRAADKAAAQYRLELRNYQRKLRRIEARRIRREQLRQEKISRERYARQQQNYNKKAQQRAESTYYNIHKFFHPSNYSAPTPKNKIAEQQRKSWAEKVQSAKNEYYRNDGKLTYTQNDGSKILK